MGIKRTLFINNKQTRYIIQSTETVRPSGTLFTSYNVKTKRDEKWGKKRCEKMFNIVYWDL